jgi:hypothetical protein
MGFNLSSVKEWGEAVQTFLRLGQAAVDKLPDGSAKDEARAALERAREQGLLAEVQLANSIGYKLCKRHRPAEVMLSIGREPKWNIEQFKCPSCGDLQPSDLYIRSLDRDDAPQRGQKSDAA